MLHLLLLTVDRFVSSMQVTVRLSWQVVARVESPPTTAYRNGDWLSLLSACASHSAWLSLPQCAVSMRFSFSLAESSPMLTKIRVE